MRKGTFRYFVSLVIAFVLSFGCIGCDTMKLPVEDKEQEGRIDELPAEESGEEENVESQEEPEENGDFVVPVDETEVKNNGGTVVGLGSDIYYWKYYAEGMENTGVFSNYNHNVDASNELICRHEDGSEEVLFTGPGEGEIYICEERIFAQKYYGTWYAMDLDGGNCTELSNVVIRGYDDGSKKLILAGEEIGFMDYDTLAVDTYSDWSYEFITAQDGYAYFSICDADQKEVSVYQVDIDSYCNGGDGQKLLGEVSYASSELYSVSPTASQISGDYLYLTLGAYAGTGFFFQDGGAYRFRLSGEGQAETLVDFGNLSSAMIYVEDTAEGTYLHYIGNEDYTDTLISYWDDSWYTESTVLDVNSGAITEEHGPFSQLGAVIYWDGSMQARLDNTGNYSELIPKEVLDTAFDGTYGALDNEDYILVKDVEIVGDQVYYTIEYSQRDSAYDVGWRTGYQRLYSNLYVTTLGSHTSEMIYSY